MCRWVDRYICAVRFVLLCLACGVFGMKGCSRGSGGWRGLCDLILWCVLFCVWVRIWSVNTAGVPALALLFLSLFCNAFLCVAMLPYAFLCFPMLSYSMLCRARIHFLLCSKSRCGSVVPEANATETVRLLHQPQQRTPTTTSTRGQNTKNVLHAQPQVRSCVFCAHDQSNLSTLNLSYCRRHPEASP